MDIKELSKITTRYTNRLDEAVNEGDFVSAMHEIRAGLDEAEYGINSLNRLNFKGGDKPTAKRIANDFKLLMKRVDKFEKDWLKNFVTTK